MSNTAAIAVALVLLGVNAFFVGAEFALISARRTTIEPKAQSGSRQARTTLGAMENVSLMMAGAQLGITICSLGLGAVGEPAVAHLIEAPFASAGIPEALLHPVAFTIALAVVVFAHVVIGEMVPKNIALAGPDRAALVLAPPLVLIVGILKPLIAALNAVANLSLRAVKVTPRDEVTSAFTREQVAALVAESHREGLLAHDARDLLSGALGFDERTARAVLLPAETLRAVPAGATPRQVEAAAAASGYSRFPVTGPDGAFTGYLHLKDALQPDPDLRGAPIPAEHLRPLVRVGDQDTLRAVLATMNNAGAHLARVTDTTGATVGLVALEDVIEELVGQIRDDNQRPRR